jgi:hypothetical protein
MNSSRGFRRVRVESGGEPLISSAGAALLMQTAAATGVTAGLSGAPAPWRAAQSVHTAPQV